MRISGYATLSFFVLGNNRVSSQTSYSQLKTDVSFQHGRVRGEVPVDSKFGEKIMSIAEPIADDMRTEGIEPKLVLQRDSILNSSSFDHRNLENYYYNYNNQQNLWLVNYAFKVQQCHHISHWSNNDEDEMQSHVRTLKKLRMRLCPRNNCGKDDARGCSGDNYGDYLVDLGQFLEAYREWVDLEKQNECYEFVRKYCSCSGENVNGEQCAFQCWYKNGRNDCYTDYTSYDEQQNNQGIFDIGEYYQCAEWNPEGDIDDNNNNDVMDDYVPDDLNNDWYNVYKNNGQEQRYYIGPYCAKQGTRVYLGLFLDEDCSKFAGSHGGKYKFKELSGGKVLPYTETSLIEKGCVSCRSFEKDNYDAYDYKDDDNNYYNQPQVNYVCAQAYVSSGKCEENLQVAYKNEELCRYMRGIKYIEQYAEARVENVQDSMNVYAALAMNFIDDNAFQLMVGSGVFFLIMILYVESIRSRIRRRERARIHAFNRALYSDKRFRDVYHQM